MNANHNAANKTLALLTDKTGFSLTNSERIALAQVYATLAVADQLERLNGPSSEDARKTSHNALMAHYSQGHA